MLTRQLADTAKTGINAIKGRMNGKKSILTKIYSKTPVGTGWKRKVDGETALMCLGYNLARAVNLLGFEKMMEVMV